MKNRLALSITNRAGLAVVSLLLSFTLVGCAAVGPGAPPPNAPGFTIPDEPSGPVLDDRCPTRWPYRVPATSDDPEELSYIDRTPVCTDLMDTVLVNNSEAVWYFEDHPEARFTVLSADENAASFRDYVSSQSPAAWFFIVPSEIVLLPTQGDGVEWHIDRELSTTWFAHDYFLSTFEKYSIALKRQALTKGSKSRKAIFDCTLAFSNASRLASVITPSPVTEEQIYDFFAAAASSAPCAASWKAVEAEAGNIHLSTWADDVAKAGKIADHVTKVRTGLKWISRACVILPRFC